MFLYFSKPFLFDKAQFIKLTYDIVIQKAQVIISLKKKKKKRIARPHFSELQTLKAIILHRIFSYLLLGCLISFSKGHGYCEVVNKN